MGERPHFSILLENFMLLLRFLFVFWFFFALKHIHDNAFFPKLQLIFLEKSGHKFNNHAPQERLRI